MNYSNTGDDSGGGCLTVVLIVRDEQADLEKARIVIAQQRNALTRGKFSLTVELCDLVGSASLTKAFLQRAHLGAQRAETGCHLSRPLATRQRLPSRQTIP